MERFLWVVWVRFIHIQINILPVHLSCKYNKPHLYIPTGPTLMVRNNSKSTPEESHSCAWAPFNEKTHEIDWLPLVTYQVTFENMTIHQLKEEDSMDFFMSTLYSIPSIKAVLLINTENNLHIDKKFCPKSEKTPVPTLVLARDVGIALRDLADINPRNIDVKVAINAGKQKITNTGPNDKTGKLL